MRKLQVRKAAVLGAGVMGAQIAAHLANAGVPVVLKRYDGMIHGFVSMGDVFDDARAAQRLIAEQLRAAWG